MDELKQKAAELAERFMTQEADYRLGDVEAEQSNPKTRNLDKTFATSVQAGVRMLQSVDQDLAKLYQNTLYSSEFDTFTEQIYNVLVGKGRIILSGCGSSGRLCMCIEKAFREAVNRCGLETMQEKVATIMTGGDYALIRSVESFEDYAVLSGKQVDELSITKADLLIGVTATGETTSVVGSAIQASKCGASVYMVVCSDPRSMFGKIERVDNLYLRDNVSVLYLPCGAMAITGSTRMQSSTIEQATIMSAFEIALSQMQGRQVAKQYLFKGFEEMLSNLSNDITVDQIAEYVVEETQMYKRGGYVTYFSENYVFDILTDTTERSPTFSTPPLRQQCRVDQPLSWAFVKNPALPNREAWKDCLGREPRCISWPAAFYKSLGITTAVPDISVDRLMEFVIGKESDPEREQKDGIAVWVDSKEPSAEFDTCAAAYSGTRVLVFEVDRNPTEMKIFEHLGMKLALNVISTSTMVLLGRISGNYMSFLNMSNKKLIDRGARIIADLCEITYQEALTELYYTSLLLEGDSGDGISITQETIKRMRKSNNVKN